MKTHPMYKKENNIINQIMDLLKYPKKVFTLFKNVETYYKVNKNEDVDVTPFLSSAIIFNEIKNNGYTFINIKDEDWEIDITQKTLEKMTLKNLNFVFKSGCIKYQEKDIYFSYIDKDTWNNKYADYVEVTDEDVFCITYLDNNGANYSIKIRENDYLFKNKNLIFKDLVTIVISVLIYAGMFKNVNDRVKISTIIGKKSSKQNIPKHTINQIKLFQKNSNEKEIIEREGSKWKSDKRWLVRGHLRNQFYKSSGGYKLIFIDPFWKGEGIVEVEKIYNI